MRRGFSSMARCLVVHSVISRSSTAYRATRFFAARTPSIMSSQPLLRFVDMGANLLDDRFLIGSYRGNVRHESDLDLIIQRAHTVGVTNIILTAGTIEESKQAVATARQWNAQYPEMHFACTVGVHPTRCQLFVDGEKTDSELLHELLAIAHDGMTDHTVVAIGEIGLDYDRLEFCPKEVQHKYFIQQLQHVAAVTKLPLFLHNRSVGKDLYDILQQHQDCIHSGGVVHSFDDSLELALSFINDLGLYIGLNGCSLRTDDNLQVAAALPLDRILLETDCPYCDIRSTHAGFQHIQTHFETRNEKKFERGKTVKGRQEPCHIVQVAEVIAGCKGVSVEQVATTCYNNALQLYRWTDS